MNDNDIPLGWAVPDDWARKMKEAKAKKTPQPFDELQESLNQAACEIAQLEPAPSDWAGWVTFILEQLQAIAENAGRRDEFDAMLQALEKDLGKRIKNGSW